MRAVLAWVAAALATAGCAQLGSGTPSTPSLDLQAGDRFGAVPAGAAAPTPADLRWWRRFDDPALGTWVERALAAHVDVALAAERTQQARALLAAARARRGLFVGAESSAELELRPEGGERRLQRTSTIRLDHDLDLWGGLRAGERSAAAQLARSEHLVQAARLATAGLAARAYVAWRLAVLDHRLLAETLALQREALRIVQVRVDAGLSPVLDRERAAADVAALEAEQAAAAERIGNAILALQVLTSQAPLLAMQEPEPGAPAGPGGAAGAGLPQLASAAPIVRPLDLLRLRPDLRAAEQELTAAAADVGVARAALLPQLRLPGALVFGAAAGAGGLELLSATLSAVASARLFDSGAGAAEVASARSQLRQAQLRYRQSLLEALRQVQAALLAQQATRERIAARERASAAARSALEQAQTLYRAGLTHFLDVADAQRTALGNQRALLQARADAAAADVQAFEAMGLIAAAAPAPRP